MQRLSVNRKVVLLIKIR